LKKKPRVTKIFGSENSKVEKKLKIFQFFAGITLRIFFSTKNDKKKFFLFFLHPHFDRKNFFFTKTKNDKIMGHIVTSIFLKNFQFVGLYYLALMQNFFVISGYDGQNLLKTIIFFN